MPFFANHSLVNLEAWECVFLHKYHLFLNAALFFFIHGTTFFSKNWVYPAESSLTPSSTLKGPTYSLPMMLAQIITPSPPRCRLNGVGAARPCATHPRDHPSGPSSVTRILSLKRTRLKSCFRYWTEHARRFSLWILVSGGLLGRLFVQNLILCCPVHPGNSARIKTCLLVWRDSFALWVWPWISWFSLSGPCWHCWSPSWSSCDHGPASLRSPVLNDLLLIAAPLSPFPAPVYHSFFPITMMLLNKNLQVKNEIVSSTTNSTPFILEISLQVMQCW